VTSDISGEFKSVVMVRMRRPALQIERVRRPFCGMRALHLEELWGQSSEKTRMAVQKLSGTRSSRCSFS
jgi:hypothetical protein